MKRPWRIGLAIVALPVLGHTGYWAVNAEHARAATGWKVAVVATDSDTSENGSLYLRAGTTLKGVVAWRLRSVITGAPLRVDVDAECKSTPGNRATRDRMLLVGTGVRTTALPLPIKGGRCSVDLWSYSYHRGAATLRIEYQSAS